MRRLLLIALALSLLTTSVDAQWWRWFRPRRPAVGAYVPPIGIPAPSFGINEVKPVAATQCPSWPTVASTNCYYVDNAHGAATDTTNTQGYPNKPRLTVPNVVYAAGSYVEIQGDGATGTYKYTTTLTPRGLGTAQNPIWFVGVNAPIFSGVADIGASGSTSVGYMIFDGLYWRNGGRISIRPRFTNNAIHHLAFRDCDIQGNSAFADGNGFQVGTSQTADATQATSDIVIYDCNIYNFGSKTTPNEQCGVYPVFHLTRFWILDSEIHDVAEDGFAGSHGGERTSSYYYIGRNQIYNNLTNAVDIKGMTHVVISENTIWDHFDVWVGGVHKSSGQGESVAPHYGGASSGPGAWRAYPDEVSILFNTIYNARYAIAMSRMGKLRIVGNVIYGIHSEPTDYSTLTEGILINGVKGDQWVVHNTVYGSDGGIRITDGPNAFNAGTTYYRGDSVSSASKTYVCSADDGDAGIVGIDPSNTAYWTEVHLYLTGNLFAGRTEASQSEIDFDVVTFGDNSTVMNDNLLHRSGGEVVFYGTTTPHDVAWLISNSAHCDTCLSSDPLLTNPGASDFTLQSGSPALNASAEGTPSVYDDFFATYGISIRYSRAGIARPQGAGWDIGAYERVP